MAEKPFGSLAHREKLQQTCTFLKPAAIFCGSISTTRTALCFAVAMAVVGSVESLLATRRTLLRERRSKCIRWKAEADEENVEEVMGETIEYREGEGADRAFFRARIDCQAGRLGHNGAPVGVRSSAGKNCGMCGAGRELPMRPRPSQLYAALEWHRNSKLQTLRTRTSMLTATPVTRPKTCTVPSLRTLLIYIHHGVRCTRFQTLRLLSKPAVAMRSSAAF